MHIQPFRSQHPYSYQNLRTPCFTTKLDRTCLEQPLPGVVDEPVHSQLLAPRPCGLHDRRRAARHSQSKTSEPFSSIFLGKGNGRLQYASRSLLTTMRTTLNCV